MNMRGALYFVLSATFEMVIAARPCKTKAPKQSVATAETREFMGTATLARNAWSASASARISAELGIRDFADFSADVHATDEAARVRSLGDP
jgi:hypothetical protein